MKNIPELSCAIVEDLLPTYVERLTSEETNMAVEASMPCVLGYNLWYFEASLPSGATGQILDIEDFLVSNLLLPIGSLIYLLFCVSKWGWGFDKYLAEANKGTGLGMSPRFKIYFQFILPMLILVILLVGLGSWGWRALICAAVAVFVWFMARRSSSKSTI